MRTNKTGTCCTMPSLSVGTRAGSQKPADFFVVRIPKRGVLLLSLVFCVTACISYLSSLVQTSAVWHNCQGGTCAQDIRGVADTVQHFWQRNSTNKSVVAVKQTPLLRVVLPVSRPLTNETEEEIQDDEIVHLDELKAALEKLSKEKQPIVATFANLSFLDMLRNWAFHVRQVGMGPRMLVAALDKKTFELCEKEGMVAVRLRAGLGAKDFRGSLKFRDMGTAKLHFLLALLQQGHDVLLSDTDTVWLANPLTFLDPEAGSMAGADVLVTSDSISHSNDVVSMRATVTRELGNSWWLEATQRGREMFGSVYGNSFNTGVLLHRATPASVTFVEAWLEALSTKGGSRNWTGHLYDDQDAFNRLMRLDIEPITPAVLENGTQLHNRIIWAFERSVRMGILPPGQFCNGHVFFLQRIPQTLHLPVFAVHNTFQFYGSHGKRLRFRELRLWANDPPEYYSEGNFLSFSADLPKSVQRIGNQIDRYMAANAFYFESLRNALVIATLLNRTLILPSLICICDRYWWPTEEPCRLPGVDVDPPYTDCPADHLLDLAKWAQAGFALRESTFLQHPNVPEEVRNSRIEISVVPRPPGGTALPPNALPQNATNLDVKRLLDPHHGVRVLHLTTALSAFCRFEEEADNKRMDWDTIHAGLFGPVWWCCEPKKKLVHRPFLPPPPLADRTPAQCGSLPAAEELADAGTAGNGGPQGTEMS